MEPFRNFDFDGNSKWQQYRSNLEIPAGKDVEPTLLKFKAKWYKREVDPEFNVGLVTNGPQPSAEPRASASGDAQPSHPPSNGQKSYASTGSQPNTRRQTQKPNESTSLLGKLNSFLSLAPQARLPFLRLVLVILAILHLQPFVSTPKIYSRFLLVAALIHGLQVKERIGLPKIWPFRLDVLTSWLKSASLLTDFQYLMMAVVFIPAKPLLLVMIPFLTLSIYHLAAYGAQNYGHTALWKRYFTRPYQLLVDNQQQALLYNAGAEIGTGFVVILNLLTPPRNIFLVFIHWQWLRMRYWSPDSANHHRMIWGQIDRLAGRYLDYVPVLKYPVNYVKRWFQSAAQQAQSR